MKSRLSKYQKLPVYQKAEELYELADVIAESLKENDMKERLAAEIVSNAVL